MIAAVFTPARNDVMLILLLSLSHTQLSLVARLSKTDKSTCNSGETARYTGAATLVIKNKREGESERARDKFT